MAISKTDFIDGKEDCTITYDENGQYKTTTMSGDKRNLVFQHDKYGNYDKVTTIEKK